MNQQVSKPLRFYPNGYRQKLMEDYPFELFGFVIM